MRRKERKRRISIDLWRSFFIRHTHPLPTAVSQFWETCLGKKRLRKCPTPTDDFCGVSRKLARTRAIIWPKIMQHVVVFMSMTRLILRLDRPICSWQSHNVKFYLLDGYVLAFKITPFTFKGSINFAFILVYFLLIWWMRRDWQLSRLELARGQSTLSMPLLGRHQGQRRSTIVVVIIVDWKLEENCPAIPT